MIALDSSTGVKCQVTLKQGFAIYYYWVINLDQEEVRLSL